MGLFWVGEEIVYITHDVRVFKYNGLANIYKLRYCHYNLIKIINHQSSINQLVKRVKSICADREYLQLGQLIE